VGFVERLLGWGRRREHREAAAELRPATDMVFPPERVREREPTDDLPRIGPDGPPPVPGAQWDEVHTRWERWDDQVGGWVVVGDPGSGVDPAHEHDMTPAERRAVVDNLDRRRRARVEPTTVEAPPTSSPPAGVAPPTPGAQWNEVNDRWERWDGSAWVAVDLHDG
jgi:hypothetical protein